MAGSNRSRSSPTDVASATAPSTFPQSRQRRPRLSILAARPAYRIADGPMSTPRRPAPRSRLAPITATGRASACASTRARLALVRLRQDGYAIRVLLADDDEGFVSSLRTLIDGQPELAVVGSASDGLGAIELTDELDP